MKLYTKKLIFVLAFCIAMVNVNGQTIWTNGGGTNVWSDPNNWSTAAVPTNADDVVFDGTSPANCDIDVAADVNNLSILAGYTGVITDLGNGMIVNADLIIDDGTYDVGSASILVSGLTTITGGLFDGNVGTVDFNSNFTISGGTFNGNSSAVYLVGNFSQSGGTFNSTNGVFTVEGSSFSRTAGTFNHNGGTVVINSTISGQTLTISGTLIFNVLEISAGAGTNSNRVLNFNNGITTATLNLNSSGKLFSYQGNISITSALLINGTATGNPNASNTAVFTLNGAGPVTIVGAGAAARNKLANITINTTGAFSISNNVNLTRTWTNTNVGSFTAGSSNVNFYGALGVVTAGTGVSTRAYFDNLVAQTSSTLTITGGSYIDLSGNLTNNGRYVGNTTLLLFTGTNAHTIGGSATSTTLNAVSKSGTGALTIGTAGNQVQLLDSIRISGGAVTATNLRLKSTSALKARIGEISGGGSLGGTISVETFIPGGTTDWAVLGASGVNGLTFNSWYGTIPMAIEGSATGVTSAGGMYFESVWRWNEANAFGYDSTVTVTDPINPGQGYWLFVGTGLSSTSNITTTVSGSPVTGSQPIGLSNSAQAGQCLVANPYASPISWDRILTHNAGDFVSDAIYIYNADLGLTTSYISGVSSHGNGANSTIPMGQGFYVEANGGGDLTLNILESDKVSNNTGANPLLKQIEPNTLSTVGSVIRLKLVGGGYTDETAIRFHSAATNGWDSNLDARKYFDSPGYAGYGKNPWTIRTTISTQSGNTDYSINSLPYALTTAAVIPVLAKVYASGQHTISGVNLNNLAPGTCVTLKDKLLNVTHNLLTGPYVCTLSDTATTARFELTVCPNITAGVNNTPAVAENIFVKQDNNGVYVDLNFEKNTKAIISANNILGQQLMTPKQVECVNGKFYLDLNAKEQIIMVNVIANDKRTTKKIFIQNNN